MTSVTMLLDGRSTSRSWLASYSLMEMVGLVRMLTVSPLLLISPAQSVLAMAARTVEA